MLSIDFTELKLKNNGSFKYISRWDIGSSKMHPAPQQHCISFIRYLNERYLIGQKSLSAIRYPQNKNCFRIETFQPKKNRKDSSWTRSGILSDSEMNYQTIHGIVSMDSIQTFESLTNILVFLHKCNYT